MPPGTPPWIKDIPFTIPPPYYGTGAGNLLKRTPIAIDMETYAAPETAMKTAGGKMKSYWRRKGLRLVCMTLAGRDKCPGEVRRYLESHPGQILIEQGVKAWKALVTPKVGQLLLLDLLRGPFTLILHNACFDMLCTANNSKTLLKAFFLAMAEGRILDTMIREMLLAISFGEMQSEGRGASFNLAALAKKYLNKHRAKGEDTWRTRFHELDGIPLNQWPSEAVDYALDDALDCLLIAICQAPIGPKNIRYSFDSLPVTTVSGGVHDEVPQLQAAWALYLMSSWGMRVDADLYKQWGEEIDTDVSRAENIARAAGFLRPNGSVDTKILKLLVTEDLKRRGIDEGHQDYPKTASSTRFPDGQLKTDKETLLGCTATEIVVELDGKATKVMPLKEWAKAGFMRKMRSTYFDPAGMGRDFAMFYVLNVLVATGRTSSRAPNMQNPPRKGLFRELFIPRAGMVFNSTDYGSVELRTLGQLHYWFFGTSALRDAFLAGVDPHALFGAAIAGVSHEEFLTRKSHEDASLRAKFKMYRQLAKALNFGAPGGLGAEKLIKFAHTTYGVDMYESAVMASFAEKVGDTAAQQEIALKFTKHLIATWKKTWPEAGRYMSLIGDACKATGRFVFVQPVSWRQRGECGYCDGNNTGFQGLAADGAKQAAWRLAVACYLPVDDAMQVFSAQSKVWKTRIWPEDFTQEQVREAVNSLFGVRPVLFIHDEVLSEGPDATAHIWAFAQGQILAETMRMYTPDVPQTADPALQRRWYKDAELCRDETGKLIPWEPET